MHPQLRVVTLSLLLLFLLGAVMVLGVGIGESSIDAGTVVRILLHPILGGDPIWTPAQETIVLAIRLPRVLLAAMVGAGLAVSGAVLQSLFRNPMADPFILGISNGAALGASSVILFGFSLGLGLVDLPLIAFACGGVTIFLVYEIARVQRSLPVTTLLLSGIAISAFLSACTSMLLFLRNENLHQIIFWMMGGLWGRSWAHVYVLLPFSLFGIGALLLFARPLNALIFGEESAHYLGIQVEQIKKLLLALTTLVTAAAVSVSGIIGFVGLITPHLVRLSTGPDHRVLLPMSVLSGAILLVTADIIARTVIAPSELPIGIITAFCGAPFFVYLLKRRGGGTRD